MLSFGQRASEVGGELWKAGTSLAARAAEVAAEEYRVTYEDLGLRIARVRPHLLAVEFPRRCRASLLAQRLRREFGDEYLVVNFSGQTYDATDFSGLVMDVATVGPVPPLDVLLRLCISAHRWLSGGSRRALVAHGRDGDDQEAFVCGVLVFYACYLSWTGAAPNALEAALEVCQAFGLPDASLSASQRRYLSYFELLQHGVSAADSASAAPDLAAKVRLARLILTGIGGDGAEREVQVWQRETLIFRGDLVAGASADGVAFRVGAVCAGDIRIEVRPPGAERPDFEVCFHASLLASTDFARFAGSELDTPGGVCSSGCSLDVFFEPLPLSGLEDSRERCEREAAAAAAAAVAQAPLIPFAASTATLEEEEQRASATSGCDGSAPTFGSAVVFDMAAEDTVREQETLAADRPVAQAARTVKTVFAPEDIDAFFDDM